LASHEKRLIGSGSHFEQFQKRFATGLVNRCRNLATFVRENLFERDLQHTVIDKRRVGWLVFFENERLAVEQFVRL